MNSLLIISKYSIVNAERFYRMNAILNDKYARPQKNKCKPFSYLKSSNNAANSEIRFFMKLEICCLRCIHPSSPLLSSQREQIKIIECEGLEGTMFTMEGEAS